MTHQHSELLGEANKTGTYRCQSMPDGSLGPLPGFTFSLVSALPYSSTTLTQGRFTVSGFHVAGPIQTGQEFHIAFEATKSSGRRSYHWGRIRHFSDNGTDWLMAIDPTIDTSPVATQCRPSWIHNMRFHATDDALPGLPVVVNGWFEGGGGYSRIWHQFPDVDTPTSNTPGIINTDEAPTGVDVALGLAHQGRAFIADQGSYQHGVSYVWTHNETLYFTEMNFPAIPTGIAGVTFGMENATGYAAGISTSYTELLLLKTWDGGVLIRGDLEDPTVIRLPGIPALGSLKHQPCNTPIGAVFLADDGAHLWSGGEASENISRDALNGIDFQHVAQGGDSDFFDYFGRVYYWYDWVIFPNNWVWNWSQQNWWRLEDTAVLKLFHAGPAIGARLYAAPAVATDGAATVYGFDRAVPASTYTWTSQPLPVLEDRQFKIREIVFVVSGVGEVQFTFRNRDGTTEAHTVFPSSNTRPQYFRKNANVTAQDIQLVINAAGVPGAGAPVVHEVRMGIQTDVHYPHDTV